jgi:flagellar motor protein MotB
MSEVDADGIEHEGGEGYFASVSDLMVGILFVFLLILTVFALNYHDAEQAQMVERERYLQAVEQAREAHAEAERQATLAAAQKAQNDNLRLLLESALSQLQRDIEDRAAARGRLLSSIETALKERGVRVEIDARSGILRLSGDLLFETGKSNLNDEARRTVQILAEVLAKILPCYADAAQGADCAQAESAILETVLIEGHTDRQRFANTEVGISQEKNDRLSTDRALTVFAELRRSQPALDAIHNEEQLPLLGVSGYGERRPLPSAQGVTEADFKQNRRIDLRFVVSARSSRELQRLREQIEQTLGKMR